MLDHRRVTPGSEFAGTNLYTWVKRGTMSVKCLAQERNAVLLSGSSSELIISLDLVSTKLYCFSARFHCYYCLYIIFSANPVRRHAVPQPGLEPGPHDPEYSELHNAPPSKKRNKERKDSKSKFKKYFLNFGS